MRARSFLVLLAAVSAWADDNITIVRKTLELEQEHVLLVDQTMEYIIQFVPNAEQSEFPMRVWFQSDAGDVTRPLLLTARQRTGAVTWQLPYRLGAGDGGSLLYELERTLCPDDDADATTGSTDCAGDGEVSRRGEFSLHVASWCAAPAALRLRAAPARAWRLPAAAGAEPLHLTATPAAPQVSVYRFPAAAEEGAEESVRLVVASPDDVCATVAVHPITCPIAQTLEDIVRAQAIQRMTVLRSGGVQLSRSRYPRGFYVVSLVAESDTACSGAPEEDPDWLWDSVWQEEDIPRRDPPPTRRKHLSYEIKPALTRREYVVGAVVTLALFSSFYAGFGLLVLAERWPRWYRCVRPRAVLADAAKTEAGVTDLDAATTPAQRRRRDSTATFDSSDVSDSESEEEEIVDASSATATATPSRSMSPGSTSPGVTAPGAASPVIGAGTGSDAPPPPPTNGRIATVEIQEEIDGGARIGGEGAVGAWDVRPFGLPVRLRVAALARRRARVLRARSQRYLHTLYTVAVFYSLPVLQFVIAFQVVLNVSGSLDLCYYNFLCAHPLGHLSDFNHVLSNLGYLLLGALFMLQLRRRRARRRAQPRHEEYGIPAHDGLLAALGAGLMVVALLSASYHVCPNALNFQFDTAFMYVLAVLSMVKIYQSRHPDINARAHATFGVLAVLIALVVWGVLGGGPLFWSVFTVLHVFTFLLLSLRIYYVGQFRLEKASVAAAAASLRARGPAAAPLYRARLVALVLANAVNWAFAIYGLVHQSANIASHLLFVLLCNALLYMVFYLCMKLLHGERPRWYAWLQLGGAAAAWAPALYYFTAGSTDWSGTAAQSRLLNHECRVLQFYDAHDLWHLLSAVALYLTFNAMLTWDDGLAAVRRTDIPVF